MPRHLSAWGRRGLGLGSVSAAALIAAAPFAAGAQSLSDALTQAYGGNPQLQAERATLRATDEDVPQALANWRPTVTVSANAGLQHSSTTGSSFQAELARVPAFASLFPGPVPSTTTTNSDTEPSSYGLSVTEPLYRGGRTVAQTEEALDLVRAERANLVNTEQTVFLGVVGDFMNVVEEQAVVDLNMNNEQVLRRQLEAAQDRFKVGEVTRTDVAQAEAAYTLAIAQRRAAQGQLQVYRAAYQRDVGTAPGRLAAPTAAPELPTSETEATGIAALAAPTVVQAQYVQKAAEDNLRLVRGQLLPSISLQGTLIHSEQQQGTSSSADDAALTAQLSMPLYEGGAVYSQSRAAQQTVAERQSQVDSARRSAVESAAQAWEQLQTARATIVSTRQQIDANTIALEGVEQEAAVGAQTVLDILNAEQTLFQSRVSLVQAQHDEIVDEFTLAAALGRLTAKNLALPVEYYDPDKNFEYVRNKWIGFGTGQ